jgi:hypothetical protein
MEEDDEAIIANIEEGWTIVKGKTRSAERGHIILDGGAATHVTGDKSLLVDIRPSTKKLVGCNDKVLVAAGIGTIEGIGDVYYLPAARNTLLSQSQLEHDGFIVKYNWKLKEFSVYKDNRKLATFVKRYSSGYGLYHLKKLDDINNAEVNNIECEDLEINYFTRMSKRRAEQEAEREKPRKESKPKEVIDQVIEELFNNEENSDEEEVEELSQVDSRSSSSREIQDREAARKSVDEEVEAEEMRRMNTSSFSKAQRKRAYKARRLHRALGHPSYGVMKQRSRCIDEDVRAYI